MPDDSRPNGNRAQSQMTRGERVRAAARTLRKPRLASWVADETGVTVKTAQKYLDQLVEDNVLRTIDHTDQTLYCVDQLMATYREVAALQREHDREELTEALESMQNQIATWKDAYDVETPSELRVSVTDQSEESEIAERKEIASEWEHLANRLPVVRAAINEYDWATERDAVSV